jgi:dCMP deaminase
MEGDRYSMNTKWDKRFLELAKHVSHWSKDPSTKVGAVITRDKKVVGIGYNGFATGINDSDERLHNRELKYRYVIHAEVNSILNSNGPVDGCTLFTYPLSPCEGCMKMVIQAGIKRVVYPTPSEELRQRWGESLDFSVGMAREAGLELVEL